MAAGEPSYISVYKAISGWKAVMIWWNPEMGGFWEPYQTGMFAYADRDQAVQEAKSWAASEGLEFKES